MGLFQGKKKRKILVAEDDESIRSIIKFTLEAADYEVVEFGDGKSALEAVPKEDPDLILLDVMMPIKNGFEVCYEVKSNTKLHHIPVIILTAMTQTSSKDDEYWRDKSRANAFITKPFKSGELVKTITDLIDESQSEGKGRFRV